MVYKYTSRATGLQNLLPPLVNRRIVVVVFASIAVDARSALMIAVAVANYAVIAAADKSPQLGNLPTLTR
jgi:hypothetical protein